LTKNVNVTDGDEDAMLLPSCKFTVGQKFTPTEPSSSYQLCFT